MSYTNSEFPYEPGFDEEPFSIPIIYLIPGTVIVVATLLMILVLQIDTITINISPSKNAISVGLDSQSQENPKSKIAPLFTPEVQYWGERITIWGRRWGVDPNLIATVMQIESCGNPQAISRAGATGLFQVMPYHFQDNEDPFKPGTNALRGIAYLSMALDAHGGDVRLGLAGYNGGINGAKKPESAWSAEMIRYVYWGTGIYKDASKGKAQSERLDEWLAAGGTHLCNQAAQNLGLTE